MDALLMAGGSGRRMGNGEKPMLTIAGKPMLDYVVEALLRSKRIDRIHIVVSPKVPRTQAYISERYAENVKINKVIAPGAGYIEDTAYAVDILAQYTPFLIIASDLPLVTATVIDGIIAAYGRCGSEALTVRVPACLVEKPAMVYHEGGCDTVPAGINILDGAHMGREQNEYVLIVDDPGIAMNVNHGHDLALCTDLLSKRRPA